MEKNSKEFSLSPSSFLSYHITKASNNNFFLRFLSLSSRISLSLSLSLRACGTCCSEQYIRSPSFAVMAEAKVAFPFLRLLVLYCSSSSTKSNQFKTSLYSLQ